MHEVPTANVPGNIATAEWQQFIRGRRISEMVHKETHMVTYFLKRLRRRMPDQQNRTAGSWQESQNPLQIALMNRASKIVDYTDPIILSDMLARSELTPISERESNSSRSHMVC